MARLAPNEPRVLVSIDHLSPLLTAIAAMVEHQMDSKKSPGAFKCLCHGILNAISNIETANAIGKNEALKAETERTGTFPEGKGAFLSHPHVSHV